MSLCCFTERGPRFPGRYRRPYPLQTGWPIHHQFHDYENSATEAKTIELSGSLAASKAESRNPRFKALEERTRPYREEFIRAAAPMLARVAARRVQRPGVTSLSPSTGELKFRTPRQFPFWSNGSVDIQPNVKFSIANALTVPWAKDAAPALIAELRRTLGSPPTDAIWKGAIGYALAAMVDDTVLTISSAWLVINATHLESRLCSR